MYRRSKSPRSILIVTNSADLIAAAGERPGCRILPMERAWGRFALQCATADIVILDDAGLRLPLTCLLRCFLGFRLVSVDLILRVPVGVAGHLRALFKRLTLLPVDKFILYFKQTQGYRRYYGLSADRTAYVPFKVNGREDGGWPLQPPDGDYVLCAGRTLRDVNSFVSAMRIATCPGLLLQQGTQVLRQHGSEAWAGELPSNVRLQVEANDQLAAYLSSIGNAKIVVIPRFHNDIAATGISTYLVAMALGKCVVISRGPGADDILKDEAVFVPPEDVVELAQAIARLWANDEERRATAARGKLYADSLGGSVRLSRDILTESLRLLAQSSSPQQFDDFPTAKPTIPAS